MKTDKNNSTDMTEIKEEYFRNLIKQGHHRRAVDMTVEVITVDSEEDEYIDVEEFEFDDALKVVPTLKIKEEPSFDMDMDSASEDDEVSDDVKKEEFAVPVSVGSPVEYGSMGYVKSPVVYSPMSPMNYGRSPGDFPVQSPVAYSPMSPMNYGRSPGDFPVQSPLFFAAHSPPIESCTALNALVKVAVEEEQEQESKNAQEKPAESDNWEEKQNRRLARDNAKRKQSTRFVARRQPRGLEEELDALEKPHTKKKPTTLTVKHETKHKHRTSPKKRDPLRSPQYREVDLKKSLSPPGEREKRHRSPKKRARDEDSTDKDMSNPLKKKRRRSKSPVPQSPSSNSRSTILIDDMSTIPLNLNQYKSKTTEKSKKSKVEQDISSERIHNLEDKLNELKILKLNYQLYQLQQLKGMAPNQFI